MSGAGLAPATAAAAPVGWTSPGCGGCRRLLRGEIERELAAYPIDQIAADWPRAAAAATLADYRSVRSFQISGNSTTSSILRR